MSLEIKTLIRTLTKFSEHWANSRAALRGAAGAGSLAPFSCTSNGVGLADCYSESS